MKRHHKMFIAALALGTCAWVAAAQEAPPQPDDAAPPRPRQARPVAKRFAPANPLVAALDANHDGVISAEEIASAPAALKALDRNHDGQITRDEWRPARRPGGPRGPAQWRGQGQPGRPDRFCQMAAPDQPDPPRLRRGRTDTDRGPSADRPRRQLRRGPPPPDEE